MNNVNEIFQKFIDELDKINENQANEVVNKIVTQMQRKMSVAETIIGGSYAKGTDIGVDSDLDLVFVLKPTFDISSEEELFSLVRKTLKPISSIEPTTPYKATKIKVDEILVDVLITKYGAQGIIGEPQQTRRHVTEILKQGTLFTNTIRILKFWKNKKFEKEHTLKSFDLEIILGYVFQNFTIANYEEAIDNFYQYIVKTKLKNQLQFPPSGNAILYTTFESPNKNSFILACESELKELRAKNLNYFKEFYT